MKTATTQEARSQDVFLVRLWHEPSSQDDIDTSVWRGTAVNVRSGARTYFVDYDRLVAFLEEQSRQ